MVNSRALPEAALFAEAARRVEESRAEDGLSCEYPRFLSERDRDDDSYEYMLSQL
jgi:hypothetical protein